MEERRKPWEHSALLQKIATDVFNSLPYNDILWIIEKERYFGNPTEVGLWKKFLETEEEHITSSGFLPSYFESKFGYLGKNKGRENSSTSLVIKGNGKEIRIYGKIDRIDVDEKGRFIVVDYKSGQGSLKIKINDLLNGLSLQLPVYLAAAKNILSETREDVMPTAGMYYQVQDAKNCKFKFVLINQENSASLTGPKDVYLPNPKYEENGKEITFDNIIEKSFSHISQYIDKMTRGNFNHTSSPKDMKCTSFCSFSRVCRKDTGKLLSLQE
jgi:hypothetical protein